MTPSTVSERPALSFARIESVVRAEWFAPLVIFGIAFIVRGAAIVYWDFHGLYGQDAYGYYDYALALRQALLHAQPPPPFFWPLAYPAFIVAAMSLVGPNAFAGQLVSGVAGSLVPVLTFLLAQEIARLAQFDARRAQWIAWLAGLWVALSAQLIQYSIVVMADMTGLALACASAWQLARYARTYTAASLYASAALLAFAFLARIQMALLGLPWALFTLVRIARGNQRGEISFRIRDIVLAGALGLAIVAPYLIWAWRNAQAGFASYAANPEFASWSPLHFFQRDFITPDGHLQFPYPTAMYYAVAVVRGGALTPLILPLALLGIWELGKRRAASALILLLGWCAVIYFFIAGMPWQNLRFAFPLYPPMAILGALGLTALAAKVQLPRVNFARAALLGAMALIVIQLPLGYWELEKFMTTTRKMLAIATWLKRELPADATVLTFSLTPMLEHETAFQFVELYFETPQSLASKLHGAHTFLLLDVPSVETQWAGRAPAINYEFLRDAVGLQEIGAQQNVTLYQVRSYGD